MGSIDGLSFLHECDKIGDRFLICSDGLTDGLWDRHIEEIVRQPSDAPVAQRLVEASIRESGRDNTTAVMMELAQPAAVSQVSPAS